MNVCDICITYFRREVLGLSVDKVLKLVGVYKNTNVIVYYVIGFS